METERTDSAGAYSLTKLRADRFLLLVRCSQRPDPWPNAIYLHDLKTYRMDQELPATWLGHENCDWNANGGTFRCQSLLPGAYSLYFTLSNGIESASAIQPQFAKVTYTVGAGIKPVGFAVQLQVVPVWHTSSPAIVPEGFLDFGAVCERAIAGTQAFTILAWGQSHAAPPCYSRLLYAEFQLSLPEGSYTVSVVEDAYRVSRLASSGRHSRFKSVLMQHGTSVQVQVGQISKPKM